MFFLVTMLLSENTSISLIFADMILDTPKLSMKLELGSFVRMNPAWVFPKLAGFKKKTALFVWIF
jgi:hypothetical protein